MDKPRLIGSADPVADPDATTTTAPDPFDVGKWRLNPSYGEALGVTKVLNTVPVKKPNKQDFVRVRSEPEYRDSFAMIELKDDREEYLVLPTVVPELSGEVVMKTVFTAINRLGVTFLWPVRLPAPDDRKSDWPRSEREAAERAMREWVRVQANMSLGAYEMRVAEGVMAEPVWPKLSYGELLRIGFQDRMVTSVDHPVIKRLRGQS
jgi:hypothetical protein